MLKFGALFVKEIRKGFNTVFNSLKLLRCGLREGAFEGNSLCQSPPSPQTKSDSFLMGRGSCTLARGVQYADISLAHTSPFVAQV